MNDDIEYRNPAYSTTPLKEIRRVFFLFVFVLGTFLVFCISVNGAINATLGTSEFRGSPTTIATITEIDVYIDSRGDKRYCVYITYNVDTISYTTELGLYTIGMQKGDTVEIKYNEEYPLSIYYKGNSIISYILLSITSIIFFLFLIVLIKLLYTNYSLKQLRITGSDKLVYVVDYEINFNRKSGKRYLYNVICRDEHNNLYVCNKAFLTPERIYPIGTELTMYIDKNNKDNYFIDCL